MVAVPSHILAEVSDCRNDFSCLKTGACQCNVLAVPRDTPILFIGTDPTLDCSHKVEPLSDVHMCNCPVANYLHRGRECRDRFTPGTDRFFRSSEDES